MRPITKGNRVDLAVAKHILIRTSRGVHNGESYTSTGIRSSVNEWALNE
jgi:hypothetical protein